MMKSSTAVLAGMGQPRKVAISTAAPASGREVLAEYSRLSDMLSAFPAGSGQEVAITHAGRVKDGWAYGDTRNVKMFGGRRQRENSVRIHGFYAADFSKKSRYANKKEEVSVYFTEKPDTIEKSVYFDQTPKSGEKSWIRTAYSVVVRKDTAEVISQVDQSNSR